MKYTVTRSTTYTDEMMAVSADHTGDWKEVQKLVKFAISTEPTDDVKEKRITIKVNAD